MYKKINIALNILFMAVIMLPAYNYFLVQNNDINLTLKINLLGKAADNFFEIGIPICIVSLIWANVMVVKTKQLFWLLLPLLYSIFVGWLIGYHEEDIFIFTKDNGMWNGGFSLSYLLSIIIIFFAVLEITINYFVLKMRWKSNLK